MSELVERYKRWLKNIGFDGGLESPPMLALEMIERQAGLLEEARDGLRNILAAPMIDHSNADRSAYGIARTTLAKLEAANVDA